MKEIQLTKGQKTIVDDDDFDRFGQFKWCSSYSKHTKSFYAVRGLGNQKMLCLHREIMNCPKGLVVDHIDHNTLNNQKKDLRICTTGQNNCNRSGATKASGSGIRGIRWFARTSKWTSQIQVNGKYIHLGYFKEKDSAIKAYADANKKHFGEFGGSF